MKCMTRYMNEVYQHRFSAVSPCTGSRIHLYSGKCCWLNFYAATAVALYIVFKK